MTRRQRELCASEAQQEELSDESFEAELRWKEGKPFYMTLTVSAPYDGCFYEPNIFLVTPVGCALQKELMGTISRRYSPRKEALAKNLELARSKHSAVSNAFSYAKRILSGEEPWASETRQAKAVEEIPRLVEEVASASSALKEAEAEYEAVKAEPAMEQPELCVWPLYASGQGMGLDAIHSLRDLIDLIEAENAEELGRRPSWPDGLQGSRFASTSGFKSWGRVRNVSFGDFGPINENSYAAERYWMQALRVANEIYDLELEWKCESCGECITYRHEDPEVEPYPTGSHGDGGVGVHYTDVMCYSCLEAGSCEVCKNDGSENCYSEKISEHGWHLCEFCTEQFAKAITFEKGEDVELPETVMFHRGESGIVCYTKDGAFIFDIAFNQSAVEEWLQKHYVCDFLDDVGLRVSGDSLAYAAGELKILKR